MKNFYQDGENLDLTAPYDVVSGAGFQVGNIFAVANYDALSGATVVGTTEGVFILAKTSAQAWSVGDPIYWDNSAKVCTNVGAGHLLIGYATQVAANPSSTGYVCLAECVAIGPSVTGVEAGYRLARGETALDGSNPTPVTTGLTTVVSFVATLKGSAAPGVGTSVLTYTASGGTVSVYAWKPTSNADPTLIASTGTETFGWVAVGT